MVKNIDTASDWLNMSIKASEQLYLPFVAKMYTRRSREEKDKYNEQRRSNKSKSRQALFVAEYIQLKWFDMYDEACVFFNSLNVLYPSKYDLRKTEEFRQWKMEIQGKAKTSRKRRVIYNNAESSSAATENFPQSPAQSPPQSPVQSPPQSPAQSPPQSPAQSPAQSPVQSPPQSPAQSPPQLPAQSPPQSPAQSPPQSPAQSPAQSPPQSPAQSPVEISPVQSPTVPKILQPLNYSDSMELKIQLLQHDKIKKRTVTTETLQVITHQEEPLTLNDIPPERINELIEQLRDDPDLRDIFTSVEEQFEFEELGMNIDIPESYPLEEELAFW